MNEFGPTEGHTDSLPGAPEGHQTGAHPNVEQQAAHVRVQQAPYPPVPHAPYPNQPGDKSFVATWLLSCFLGVFGIDRFYLGKIGTGFLKLVTFGGLGLWWLIDLILVLTGAARDKQGRALEGYDRYKKVAWIITGAVLLFGFVIGATAGGSGSKSNQSSSDDPSTNVDAADDGEEGETQDEADEADESEAAPAPEPEETVQDWVADEFDTFSVIEESGTNDSLVDLPEGISAGTVTANHEGQSNFSISVLDANNNATGDLLVNEIGDYTGVTAWGLGLGEDGTKLQISADGQWEIEIAPFTEMEEFTGTVASEGDAVLLYDGPAANLDATHSGDSNFSVIEETTDTFNMGLLINEIGSYSGTVPLSAGPSIIIVGADGSWEMTTE